MQKLDGSLDKYCQREEVINRGLNQVLPISSVPTVLHSSGELGEFESSTPT